MSKVPLHKGLKDFNHYVTGCLVKIGYDSVTAMKQFAKKFPETLQYGYKCKFCGRYHITTHPNSPRDMIFLTAPKGFNTKKYFKQEAKLRKHQHKG